MYLKSIQLREWKAYALAKFDFPSPRTGKNIVLIGAQNGYGKTSLFEAVVLEAVMNRQRDEQPS